MKNKKITLKEFFNADEKLGIHCKNEEEAKKLCEAFDKMGKKWNSGNSYLETNWSYFLNKTCYLNSRIICETMFCKYRKYKVYEFEDVILEI